jgi:hypothetical protein
LLCDVAETGLAVGAADGRCQAGPRAQLARRGEAGNVAYLGDHQHRGVAPHAAELAEHLDPIVALGERVDLAGGRLDLAVEVSDQGKRALEPPAGRLS